MPKVPSLAKSKSAQGLEAAPISAERAEVHWEGNSKEVLQGWPRPVRSDFGFALNEMQEGRPATLQVRPMQSIGPNVFELKSSDEATWYRLMYLARVDNVIYVLDCFEKDTAKTERKDIARSEARFRKVQQRLREERKDAKHSKPARPRDEGKRP